MAITYQISEPNFDKMVTQTAASATADDNVFGTTGTVYKIVANNSAAGNDAYLKIYDNTGPTVGTTAPTFQLFCKRNQVTTCFIRKGLTISNALSIAGEQTAGTAGTTGAASSLRITLFGV